MGEPRAFTSENVRDLTGLPIRQLHYWDATGFFSPESAHAEARRPYSRLYSFRDVVGLRAIAILRNEHHVSLQDLRRVGIWLSQEHDTPWASLRFYIAGRRVFFDDPRIGRRVAARPIGQAVLPFEMEPVAAEMSGRRSPSMRTFSRRD